MMTESSSRALDSTTADAEAQDAFGELVRRYQDAAFASAYAILKDRGAAEDATQAAFLTAWLRRNDLREPLAFGSWLRAIVRTECFRIVRRGRVTTVPLDEMPATSTAPAPDPVHAAELRTVLLDAIATLSEADRTVIGLRYMSDSSYQEISDFLGLPVSTVKKRLHDARKRLLAWFKSQTAGALARAMLREFRPSRDAGLEARVMNLTAFLDKVVRGDIAAVSAALDAQPALRDRKGEGKPLWSGSANALTVAAMCGRADMVKLLIGRGAPLEPDNATGVSPLVSAAVEGRSDVVRVLLEAGAMADIFAACALGDGARASILLAADPGVARARASDGKTPLHFCRSVDVAGRLLDAGARPDLDAVDDAGVTPLAWIGATGRYKDVCRYLIAQGATVESSDIFAACAHGDVAAVTRLLDEDHSLVAARLPGGAGVHRVSIGTTPLHVAAVRGEQQIATLLIQRGADVNAQSGENQAAPLHVAAAGGHFDVVRTLVTAGADTKIRDGAFAATPEEWARFFGHSALGDLLRRLSA
jgi:RNA polymerase sigma factor (sigma-70 family)